MLPLPDCGIAQTAYAKPCRSFNCENVNTLNNTPSVQASKIWTDTNRAFKALESLIRYVNTHQEPYKGKGLDASNMSLSQLHYM